MANVLHRTTKQYLTSVNTPDFPVLDWILNPDLSAVTGFASKYWSISGDTVTLMGQAERDAVDAAEAAALIAAVRAAAKAGYDAAVSDLTKALKAVALVTQDELNLHALKINAILDAIDVGTTLAQVKANVAAIADYPQRTPAQLKTAVDNKVDTL